MPMACSICTHPHRDVIDTDLASGVPNRRIAARYAVTEQALRRHKANHLPAALAKAAEATQVASADALLREVSRLHGRAVGIIDRAERTDDLRAATGAIREALRCVELLARLSQQLDDTPAVNISVMPAWDGIRTTVVEALAAYPEARAAVADRLLALEGRDDLRG